MKDKLQQVRDALNKCVKALDGGASEPEISVAESRGIEAIATLDEIIAGGVPEGWALIDKDTPKDKKVLMGCWHESKWYEDVGTLWGKQGRRTICVGFRKNKWPTHWMPLPAAPQPPTGD